MREYRLGEMRPEWEPDFIRALISTEGLNSRETAVALYAGLQGARIALSYWGKSPEELQTTYKLADGYTPVTQADRESEEAMAKAFGTYFPDYSIYGEDTERKTGIDPENTVVMDGVDGSLTFARGDYTWAVALAICRQDPITLEKFPISSVIVLPALGIAVVAQKNKGTVSLRLGLRRPGDPRTLEIIGGDRKCHVSKLHQDPNRAFMHDLIISPDGIFIEKSNGPEKDDFLTTLRRSAGKINIRAGGSNSHSGALVAMGTADATIMDCIGGVFDALPSALAVEEAGGNYTDKDGNRLSIERAEKVHLTIGSNGAFHDELLAIARTSYPNYLGWRTER